MCFAIESKHEVAHTDLIVFKNGKCGLTNFTSIFFPTVYEKNVLYEKNSEVSIHRFEELVRFEVWLSKSPFGNFYIFDADTNRQYDWTKSNFNKNVFHTYISPVYMSYDIGMFLIPKGTIYWVNSDETEIATTRIKYLGNFENNEEYFNLSKYVLYNRG